jgi:hypothetical protein
VVIVVDFDGTIVEDDREYDDLVTPLRFKPWAREALLMLKHAGHTLVLQSARASRDLLFNPELDPLVRAGVRFVSEKRWHESLPLNWARYEQMKAFVASELPGVFAAIDDGASGKLHADLFIDDKGQRYGAGMGAVSWQNLALLYGQNSPQAVVSSMS